MKKIIIICLLFLCGNSLIINAQMQNTTTNGNTPNNLLTHEEYLTKSKNQKLFGFIFLGAGVTTLAIISAGNTDLNAVGPLAIVGGAAALGSIPLFIAAGKNKRKAELVVKNEKVFFNPVVISKEHFIALGVKIKL
ncbi:MAG: hypothetical protein M3004_02565 [Bacteroidota bacterium]|nr:hypothetical protein [Bacteroidota bacterium]